MFSVSQQKKLLKLAKDSIITSLKREEVSLTDYSEFNKKLGVFVTLRKNDELRGCIGYPYPDYALNEAIVKAAKAAAFNDPRFPAVQEKELKGIKIEISVLTQPKLVVAKKASDIIKNVKVGKDGLIIECPLGSGLLLPQVAEEQGWTCEEFLEGTCLKAGLPRNYWIKPETKIYKFQAEIFSEQ